MGENGRHHTRFINDLFNESGLGVDLGNIEIKESTRAYHKFTVHPKDMEAEFFLFYDHPADMYALVKREKLPIIEKKRTFRLTQVIEQAYFVSKNYLEIMKEVHKIIKDPSYCKFTRDEVEEMLQNNINFLKLNKEEIKIGN